MKVVLKNNLDLEVILSRVEVESLECKSSITKNEDSIRIDYNWPILQTEVLDGRGDKIGKFKLQNCVEHKLMYELDFNTIKDDRGVFFIKSDFKEWDIRLNSSAYTELINYLFLTRRIPFHNSQFYMSIQ